MKNKLVINKNVQKKYKQTCKKINRNVNKLAILIKIGKPHKYLKVT